MAGRELTLTNLDKIIYPETGTTKADVLAYYAAVAHVLIPAAANRPATRKRWVNGVGTAEKPGEVFFQKNLEDSAPDWLPRAAITHKDRTIHYPMVNDPAVLTWFGQINSLEIHVPQWRVDSQGTQLNPDRLVLDLDPGEGAGLADCREVALLARAILQDVGLAPVPVTSGSKGIHLYAPLDGTQTSDQISEFARELARALESDHPDLAVSDMKKTLRKGKVLVDWSQNNAAKTTIVPYSLRGRPTPMVAAPRTWREISSPRLKHLDYQEVLRRVQDGKDPFAAVVRAAGTLDDGDGGTGTAQDGTHDGHPRLAKYRAMRDPKATPEPFSGAPRGGDAFVIQEHHASRLHWDLRLEHEGVLASWALPKGVPESGGKNHLAVQTEDHPMDYLTFHGTIPKGEYGAGDMTIWDTGTYELHKWINGKEVIVTLTGSEGGGLGGTRKVALIHTGRGQGSDAEKQWLIHLMDKEDQGARRRHAPSSAEPAGSAEDVGSAGKSGDASNEQAGAKQVSPDDVRPMMATAGVPSDLLGSDWQVELKWDGVRAILVADESSVRIFSRNGNDVTRTYPELTDRRCWPEQPFVADGEIIAVGPSGRPDFGLLQGRMKLTRAADVVKAQKALPVRLMLFDLLHDGGTDLRRLPLRARRQRLEQFFQPSDCPVELSMVLEDPVEHIMDSARELGLEGVMAKRTDSRYVSGQRTRTWIKLKTERTQEVVVGGWRPGKGGRQETVGSLLVGIPDGNKLQYVGRVGSGFSGRELAELRQTVEQLARKTSPFHEVPRPDSADAHWVTPQLVGEVTYGEWTGPGRLRHPRWRGWRLDKDPSEVVRED
ncbi:DNA polymerase LigD, ligase domain protein [Pseudarthrobacter chlorophenolicus A6]|uniref:DNA ligase (ATP) n=1 Tax=Pseudarthrobacter chlorophenolicus (strain ATCC 700700 / DSM 12829 / CIP 107037 / JCM 12360 / KCTC 9906 / NCIMB 13794 / A6) TaxID=452863 RepID=B8HAQ8_PSECP|nr:DNA polymerase LigD, ligase domain protein [Pseudarthrobacter chlorophenolicus A6]SDQ47173.1 ATP-dependent DNA ligase LigD ligase module /ATP-dependent DNA ligase LigD phosphoesterase module /ATP-dependent DNA ligase LigD polymerase module [Pseudarthrobacter chlorophenolicus]